MSKPITIDSHNGLRGIAAISVFIAHIYIHQGAEWDLELGIFRFFRWEQQAVDLFFILSGFILNYVYTSTQESINWRTFFLARIGRICPLYYLTTIVSIPIIVYSYLKHGLQYIGDHNYYLLSISNIFILSGVLGVPSFNNPSWSISVELFCYIIVFPILIYFKRVINKHNFINLLLIFILTHCLVLSYNMPQVFFYGYGWNLSQLFRGIFGFSTGFLICAVFYGYPQIEQKRKLINFVLFFAVCIFIYLQTNYNSSKMFIYAIPFIIYFSAFDKGIIAYFLRWRPFQLLGDRSYSIYLWHMPLLKCIPSALNYFIDNKSFFWGGNIKSFILIFFVFIASDLSYRYFEIPCRYFIRNFKTKPDNDN